MEKLLILGAGKIGAAIAGVLEDGRRPYAQWDAEPGKVPNQGDLDAIVPGADVVLICVPSPALRQAAQSLRTTLRADAVVLTVSKGLEVGTQRFMHQVLADELPGRTVGLLYGPMLADELLSGRRGAATVALSEGEAFGRVAEHFRESRLIIDSSDDLAGVAALGVLKNIYAISLGIAEGMGWGQNERGWLIGCALREVAQILPRLGGRPETMYAYAGIADVIATALSEHSKNHQYGVALATGQSPLFAEGAVALSALTGLLGEAPSYPLLAAIAEVVVTPDRTHKVFTELATRG